MYMVLSPIYTAAGFDVKGNKQYSVSWKAHGLAKDMEDARRFTPYPVLESFGREWQGRIQG